MNSNEFMTTLGQMRKGRVLHDLSEKLADVIEGVRDVGREGSLTLKILVKPIKGSGEQVLLSDDIKPKVPKKDSEPTLFYTDEGGVLTRNDPRQRDWVAEQTQKEEADDAQAAVN